MKNLIFLNRMGGPCLIYFNDFCLRSKSVRSRLTDSSKKCDKIGRKCAIWGKQLIWINLKKGQILIPCFKKILFKVKLYSSQGPYIGSILDNFGHFFIPILVTLVSEKKHASKSLKNNQHVLIQLQGYGNWQIFGKSWFHSLKTHVNKCPD
jgi:hypothetical protein